MTPFITYSHNSDPDGQRYRQLACDPLPVWAVNVQEDHTETQNENIMLKEYSQEIYGNPDTLTMEILILSHRHLRKFMMQENAEHVRIREEVRKKALIDSEDRLKHGEYITRDKLESMTMREISEFIGD